MFADIRHHTPLTRAAIALRLPAGPVRRGASIVVRHTPSRRAVKRPQAPVRPDSSDFISCAARPGPRYPAESLPVFRTLQTPRPQPRRPSSSRPVMSPDLPEEKANSGKTRKASPINEFMLRSANAMTRNPSCHIELVDVWCRFAEVGRFVKRTKMKNSMVAAAGSFQVAWFCRRRADIRD